MKQNESPVLIKWRDSSSALVFFELIFGAAIVTLFAMTGSFLITLLSSGEDGTRYCFFKTIFLKIITNADGVTTMSFGLTDNYFPIIFFFGVLVMFSFGTYVIAKKLLKYRQYLIENH